MQERPDLWGQISTTPKITGLPEKKKKKWFIVTLNFTLMDYIYILNTFKLLLYKLCVTISDINLKGKHCFYTIISTFKVNGEVMCFDSKLDCNLSNVPDKKQLVNYWSFLYGIFEMCPSWPSSGIFYLKYMYRSLFCFSIVTCLLQLCTTSMSQSLHVASFAAFLSPWYPLLSNRTFFPTQF